jgi:hypothetical protein
VPVITELWRSLEPVTADPFIAEFSPRRAPDAPVSTTGGEHELPATADLSQPQLGPGVPARLV